MTRFAEVAATSAAVGATRSRTDKVVALAELLGRLGPDEVVPVVAMLTGALVRGEPLGPVELLAMACSAGAVALALLPRRM